MKWIEFKGRFINLNFVRHINYVDSSEEKKYVEFHHKKKFRVYGSNNVTTTMAIECTSKDWEQLKEILRTKLEIN